MLIWFQNNSVLVNLVRHIHITVKVLIFAVHALRFALWKPTMKIFCLMAFCCMKTIYSNSITVFHIAPLPFYKGQKIVWFNTNEHCYLLWVWIPEDISRIMLRIRLKPQTIMQTFMILQSDYHFTSRYLNLVPSW